MGATATRYVARGHSLAYHASSKKLDARRFIAECWRAVAGQSSIPQDRQYWTLCGRMAPNGILQEGSELCQLEALGLFQPSQFVGVERMARWQTENQQAVRQRYAPSGQPVLLSGDIIDALQTYQVAGKLAASIINLDTPNEACPSNVPLLWRTLNFLNHVDGPTMVVWNAISWRQFPRTGRYPWDAQDESAHGGRVLGYVRDTLCKDMRFAEAYRHGWDMFPEGAKAYRAARYDGTSTRSQTEMTMYVFVRRRRACKDGCKCSG